MLLLSLTTMLLTNMAWNFYAGYREDDSDALIGTISGAFKAGFPTALGLIAAYIISAVLGIG